MILTLSFGFGLGVLCTVLAHEYERRRKRPIHIFIGEPFANDSIRSRRERAAELVAQRCCGTFFTFEES